MNSVYNVDCLQLLERLPPESATLAYLDPPWALQSLWDYDDRKADVEAYVDFLKPRLRHVHRVLKPDGHIFVHLDPRMSHYVRALLDHVFTERNFRGEYIIPRSRRYSRNQLTHEDHSLIAHYGKSEEAAYVAPTRSLNEWEIESQFPSSDDAGRYRLVNLLVRIDRPQQRFEWNGILPPDGMGWRFSKNRLDELAETGSVSFDVSRRLPSLKQYYADGTQISAGTIWNDLTPTPPSHEKTGFIAQQPVKLLTRVILAGSKEGDVVLDPFCGTGTCLVAAHMAVRKWLGCDISELAFSTTKSRLETELGLTDGVDFVSGDLEIVTRRHPHRFLPAASEVHVDSKQSGIHGTPPKYVAARNSYSPRVFTEGKTDWKHLKAAYMRLVAAGYLSLRFDVEFNEYEEIQMGDRELLNMCRAFSKILQVRPMVFIFDRDNKEIVRKVEDSGKYRDWGNGVYSFALPVPAHRETDPEISVELYYPDDDIIRKDESGRRLFLSSEFHADSGRHQTEDLNCTDRNKLGGPLRVIDNMVFDSQNRNVALPKNEFAAWFTRETNAP